jgi:purine-nucleoside phosphorylase
METFALFHNAKALNKKATALLTVSDSLITGASLDAEAREKNFKEMMEIALKSV